MLRFYRFEFRVFRVTKEFFDSFVGWLRVNKSMKKIVFVAVSIFLLSSCGYFGENLQVAATITNTPSTTSISTAETVHIENTERAPSINGLVPDDLKIFIGTKYPPLPEGFTQRYGLVIWDSDDFSLDRISDGDRDMLWLSKLISRDINGHAILELKDILVLPNLDIEVVLVDDLCMLNGYPNSEIIAIGKTDKEVYSTRQLPNEKILFAWRANTSLGIFQSIPTKGVECFTG